MADQTVKHAIREVISFGGVFFSLDTFFSWCFYGSLVVQILQYTAALRTTLRKERVWQVWAVAAVFVLSSLQTAVNVSRVINIYVRHWGEAQYVDNYRRRPVGPFLSFLGLVIIAAVQIVIRSRTIALRDSIWHGPQNWIQKSCTVAARILLPVSLVAGFVGNALVLQYPKYSDIIREVLKPKKPAFLILQILFNAACLALCLLKQCTITYDVLEARRCTTTTHPNAQRTWDILRDLWRVSLQNSIIVIITHCLMLLSLCLEGSASISGRPCCTLSAVYAHSLVAHILSPQLTRKRHVLEDGSLDAFPQQQDEQRKNLFGLGRAKRRSKARSGGLGRHGLPCLSSSSVTSNGSSRAGVGIGFLTLIRGDSLGKAQPSRWAQQHDESFDRGVRRTVEVVSYANREEDFEALPLARSDALPNAKQGVPNAPGNQVVAEEEDWTTLRNRIGYGHACWVTTTASQRPLTPQTHFLSLSSPAPSPQVSRNGTSAHSRTPTPEPPLTKKRNGDLFLSRPAGHRRSATSVTGPTRCPTLSHMRRRSSFALLGGGVEARTGSAPTRSAAPVHDELAFVQSFPSGAVQSTTYGVYDPDLIDSLALPELASLPVPADDRSSAAAP